MSSENDSDVAWDVWETPEPPPSFAEKVVDDFRLHVEFEAIIQRHRLPEAIPSDRFAELVVEKFLNASHNKSARPASRRGARAAAIGSLAILLPLAACWLLKVEKLRIEPTTGALRGAPPEAVRALPEPGHLWDSLNGADGSWTGDVRDLQSQFSLPGPITSIAGAVTDSETHLLLTQRDGLVWHARRRTGGSWMSPSNLQGKLAFPGTVANVAGVAGLNTEAQFLFTTRDGHLWHAVVHADGSWTAQGELQAQLALSGPVAAVAGVACLNGETQFLLITRDGHAWSVARRANGTWTGAVDMQQAVFAVAGPILAVAGAAGATGEAHFLFTTISGRLWHALRRANGTWQTPDDVQAQLATSSYVSNVVAATDATGGIRVLITTSEGHLWRTLLEVNGTWTALTEIPSSGLVTNIADITTARGETEFLFITK